ncbi:MAG: inositol monophosphatase family protein [Alphaproteobacteria bacterium]
MTDLSSYAEDRALIAEAVRAAGVIARDAFVAGDCAVWDKVENHPVTDADIAVNDYLLETLLAARPSYGWLSEETQDDFSRHTKRRTFVVDPIDGTRAFIDRKPSFAVCVGIIENGVAVSAALYNPMTNELYEAHLGGGAQLNGARIKAGDRESIDGCSMVGYPRKFRRLDWPDMNVSVINSMAYRIALVASGARDATVSFTPKSDWDLAAAELIAREAGAVITNLRGEIFRYDQEGVTEFGVICAGPKLHALLLERVTPVIDKFEKSENRTKDFGFMGTRMTDRKEDSVQLLHLVIGGELIDPNKTTFKNLKEVDFIGAFGSFAEAKAAWKSAAQRTVDNAHMRYFVLHAHELIDPDKDGVIG